MENFSLFAKEEILEQKRESACCSFAALSALVRTLGTLNISSRGISLSLTCESEKVVEFVLDGFERYFGDNAHKIIKSSGRSRFEIEFLPELSEKVLREFEILKTEKGNRVIEYGIGESIFGNDCCKWTYLKFAFVGTGSVSLPGDFKNAGYHLEFSLFNDVLASDIAHLLAGFGFLSKKVTRGDRFVVYLKDAEAISDLLAGFAASGAALKLQERLVTRDMRNQINRQTNCQIANISKTVEAGMRQISAINVIEKAVGLDGLSHSLKEMAILRKANPESSLSELMEKLPGVSKSTIKFRLNALEKIARELKD